MHVHVYQFLSDKKLLDNIQEYQSISFHCPPAVFFEAMMLLAAGSALWQLQRGRITPALLTVAWTHSGAAFGPQHSAFHDHCRSRGGALVARRDDSPTTDALPGTSVHHNCEICEELKPMERAPRAYVLSGFSMLLIGALFATGAKGFEAQFNPESFPIQAIPLVEHSSAQRIFTYDQWADYLIYRLYPKKPVFMDGRSDFFGTPIVTATQHILAAQYDWKIQLRKFNVDMILVKPDAPLCAVLKMSPDWALRFDDGKVLVFESTRVSHSIATFRDPKFRAISELNPSTYNSPNDSVLERRAPHD